MCAHWCVPTVDSPFHPHSFGHSCVAEELLSDLRSSTAAAWLGSASIWPCPVDASHPAATPFSPWGPTALRNASTEKQRESETTPLPAPSKQTKFINYCLGGRPGQDCQSAAQYNISQTDADRCCSSPDSTLPQYDHQRTALVEHGPRRLRYNGRAETSSPEAEITSSRHSSSPRRLRATANHGDTQISGPGPRPRRRRKHASPAHARLGHVSNASAPVSSTRNSHLL